MTRKLPWTHRHCGTPNASGAGGGVSSADLVNNPGSSNTGSSATDATDATDATNTPARSTKPLRDRALRTPSTSPPPAALVESFMIDGYDADDMYRMVEDEFLTIAGTFTAHLHKAEYQRLKNLARDRNSDKIHEFSRPVVGAMTDAVKRRHAMLDLVAKQQEGLKRARGESAESDDQNDWMAKRAGTALRGLMNSSRKKAMPLPLARGGSTLSERRWSSSPEPASSRQRPQPHGPADDGDDSADPGDGDLDGSSSLFAPSRTEAASKSARPPQAETHHDDQSPPRPQNRHQHLQRYQEQQGQRDQEVQRTSASAVPTKPGRSEGTPTAHENTRNDRAGLNDDTDNDESGIMQRIRKRRSRQKLQTDNHGDGTDDRRADKPPEASEGDQDASLSYIPSFI